jgi:uncharacterized protein YbjT (DUF2867 family)
MGAGGYVGSRLVPALLEQGHTVRATFTDPRSASRFWWGDRVDVVGLDVRDRESARTAAAGTEALVYLVHGLAGADFPTVDRESAYNVAHAAVRARVTRLVYLGGLVPDVSDGDLSPHLRSRLEVEQVLTDSGVPTAALRAAMVVGSGSTSFEIMRHLSARMPVQVVPTWLRHRVEPVAVTDVVAALVGALTGDPATRSYDVGCGERLPYADLLRRYARAAGLRRPQLPALLPVGVVAQLAPVFTGVPAATVRTLVESLPHDMVCREKDWVRALLPPGSVPVTVDEALRRALRDGDTDPRTADILGPLPTDPVWAGA